MNKNLFIKIPVAIGVLAIIVVGASLSLTERGDGEDSVYASEAELLRAERNSESLDNLQASLKFFQNKQGSIAPSQSGKTNTSQPKEVTTEFLDTVNHWSDNYHWSSIYVEKLEKKGVIDGRGPVRYSPDAVLKRCELVKIAVTAFDHPLPERLNENPASDVPKHHWCAPYLQAAFDGGLIYGLTKRFGAGLPVTRAFAATVLVEAGEFQGIMKIYDERNKKNSDSLGFNDVEPNEWYSPHIAFLDHYNLVHFDENGDFGVSEYIYRGQAAELTVLLMDLKDDLENNRTTQTQQDNRIFLRP
jgi:hypothetical protein